MGIKLMTNNPRKVRKLGELGVNVEGTNQFNHRYLEAKHERMDHTNLGHFFDDGEIESSEIESSSAASDTEGEIGEEMEADAEEEVALITMHLQNKEWVSE